MEAAREGPLTPPEAARLQKYEEVIGRGERSFAEEGEALAAIRDDGLYREYGTFEDYCRDRWGMAGMTAYRFIEASKVLRNLTNWLEKPPILPAVESQARPLTKLKPEQQREAWSRAVATAPEGKVTAAHVKEVVREITGTPEERKAEPWSIWDAVGELRVRVRELSLEWPEDYRPALAHKLKELGEELLSFGEIRT